jgi:hypothetical protein
MPKPDFGDGVWKTKSLPATKLAGFTDYRLPFTDSSAFRGKARGGVTSDRISSTQSGWAYSAGFCWSNTYERFLCYAF